MIIITGASRGIGGFLFEKYLSLGVPVKGLCKSGSNKNLDKVDVRSFEEVCQWTNKLLGDETGQITLINCAAISYSSFAHKADPAKWEEVIRSNLTGAFFMIECLLPMMRKQGYGRIINFSSVVAQKGVCGTSAYAASKAALWGLSKCIAQENGSKHVTINTINLGYADIGMGKSEIDEERATELKRQIPSGRFCMPEEIFSTVQYIRDVEYLNGSTIDLCGGLV